MMHIRIKNRGKYLLYGLIISFSGVGVFLFHSTAEGHIPETGGMPVPSAEPIQIQFYMDGEPVQVPDQLLDSLSKAAQNRPVEIYTVKGLLSGYFAGEGYFSASIDSISVEGDMEQKIHIHTSPGCRYSIGSMDYSITDNEQGLFDDFIAFYGEGDLYNTGALEEDMRRRIRHLESQGYPLASLDISDFNPDPSTCEVALVIHIGTGDKLYAAGVRTSGLMQHHPDYIETATGIRPNDLITPDLFQRGRRNLENTGLFYEVSEGDIIIYDSEPYVYYRVSERRANQFDLMFGYVPEQIDGYQIIGSGHLLVRNAGWSGSTLDLSFDRLEEMATKLDVEYGRQWIMGLPAGASAGFRFLQQDTSYQVREWRIQGSWNLNPERKISLHLRQEHAVAGTQAPGFVRVLDGVTRSAGLGFHNDNRDNRNNPTRGYQFNLYVETGFRRVTDVRVEELQSRGTMTQQRVNSSVQSYFSPFSRHVITPRIAGSMVQSPEYTETDLIRLGGSRSIRGYREEQFRVSRALWGDVEYRYLLDAHSHAFLFGAGGVYEQPELIGQNRPGEKGRLQSGGFGFRYQTPIGLMQFTYAVSTDDPLYNGKVHFSLSAQF